MTEKTEKLIMFILSIPAQIAMLPLSLIVYLRDKEFYYSTWSYAMGAFDLIMLWIFILSLIL